VDAEQPGGAQHDREQLLHLVVLELRREPEPVAQRRGDQARAGGGADEGEARQVETDRAGPGPLADHDVELEVLHRRVEDLLHGAGQAVHLVEEQHVAGFEAREDRGEVAGPFDRRAGRGPERGPDLRGDDRREGGLAEPGRAREQDVVGGLAATAGAGEHQLELPADPVLADELLEPAGRRLASTRSSPGSTASSSTWSSGVTRGLPSSGRTGG
jgi:hypothetical protein